MFNPLACVSPRLQPGRAGGEEETEPEAGGGGGREASRCSITSSMPSSTPMNPSPTMKNCNSGGGKNGSLSNCRVNNKKKNPYSTRGLDRFSILLADLEEKKRKIYAQVGSHRQDQEDDYYDVPYIQFIYSANSGDWVPIVVRLGDVHRYHHGTTQSQSHSHSHEHKNGKGTISGSDGDGKKDKKRPRQRQDGNYTSSGCTTMITTTTTTSTPIKKYKHCSNSKASSSSSSCPEILNQFQLQQQQQQQQRSKPLPSAFTPYSADDGDGRTASTIHKTRRSSSGTEEKWRMKRSTRRPSEYLPLVVLLSLVWLLMFGRSVAILLTSAWWYLVPTMKTPTRPHHPPITGPTIISSSSSSNSRGKYTYAKRPNESSSFTRHKNGRSWGSSHRP